MNMSKDILKNLKNNVEDNKNTLIEKNKDLKKYENIQCILSIGAIGVFLIYNFIVRGSYSLIRILETYQFFTVLLGVLILNIVFEKLTKQLKEEIKKLKETIRNSMILKICSCNGNCNCKEDLNDYLKKCGIKII